eukprot:TRINITY_DN5208_c0_g1_i1.p1 TRINITY_DN5208_c0_g1~~TRINITY_DN5208_c0_g1_i1.p1  ORF type:complete len:481 (-),score=104.14 TRINITY_DN5208_c0_g1_i1:4-1446(-)
MNEENASLSIGERQNRIKENHKISEKMRRDRLRRKFQTLQELLPSDSSKDWSLKSNVIKRKLTEEEVLTQTLTYLNQLKNEIKEKKMKRPTIDSCSFTPSVAEFENSFICIAKTVLFKTFELFPSSSIRVKLYTAYNTLQEISHKMTETRFHLQSLAIKQIYNTHIGDSLDEVINASHQMYLYALAIEKNKERSTFCPCDPASVALADESSFLILKGQVDRALDQQYILQNRTKTNTKFQMMMSYLLNRPTLSLLGLFTLESAKAFTALTKGEAVMETAATMIEALALLNESKKKEEKEEAFDKYLRYLQILSNLYGYQVETVMTEDHLNAYFKAGKFKEGAKVASEIISLHEKFEFHSRLGKSETLRLKAELLMHCPDFNFQVEKSLEINHLLQQSMSNAHQSNNLYCRMTTLTSQLRFWMMCGNSSEIEKGKLDMELLLAFFSKNSKKLKIPAVSEAEEVSRLATDYLYRSTSNVYKV